MVGQLRKHREHLEELVEERTSKLEGKTIELEQANIHLQELDRLKSVFLASMSHELRTPLNSIIGFTGIILQGMSGEVSEEQRKQLTMVKNSASHLLSLINDILDISKIEAGRVELSPEEFSLDGAVREVVETLSPTASEKGLEFMTEVPEGITLFSDKRRVKQVLMNLVSNAVKFTDQGSVKITSRVPGDETLEVRVIDTGVGIKREDMDKLFQPFQQIDVSLTKKHEGTGLGLHLSRKLADLLGGDVLVKSEYGKGSEFTFTMPLRYEEGQKSESR
jgi:signal transduction histidine kinase